MSELMFLSCYKKDKKFKGYNYNPLNFSFVARKGLEPLTFGL